jgi:hypothetical protein
MKATLHRRDASERTRKMVNEDDRRYTDYSIKLIRKETAKAKDGIRAVITAGEVVNLQGQQTKVLEGRVMLLPDITFNGPNREPQSSYLVHTVRCQDLFCSCGRFQNNKLPCSHACCLILKAGRNIFDYMGQFWDCYTFQSAYNQGMRKSGTFDQDGNEIGYLATMKAIVLDEVQAEFFHEQVSAPPLRRKLGRKQTVRFEAGSKAVQRAIVARAKEQNGSGHRHHKCTRCGQLRHHKDNKKCIKEHQRRQNALMGLARVEVIGPERIGDSL